MGKVLSLINGPTDPTMFDFREVTDPKDTDRELWDRCMKMLEEYKVLVKDLQQVPTGGEVVLKITSKGVTTEDHRAALDVLLPRVEIPIRVLSMTDDLSGIFVELLFILNERVEMIENEALVRPFGEVLMALFELDMERILKPGVNNDFSYLKRIKNAAPEFNSEITAKINDTALFELGMFLAQGNTVVTKLEETIKDRVKKSKVEIETLYPALVRIAHICSNQAGLKSEVLEASPEYRKYYLDIMSAILVVIDRVKPTGVFVRPPLNLKKCLKSLKQESSEEIKASVMSRIKFVSVHYNDANTPGYVTSMLEQ